MPKHTDKDSKPLTPEEIAALRTVASRHREVLGAAAELIERNKRLVRLEERIVAQAEELQELIERLRIQEVESAAALRHVGAWIAMIEPLDQEPSDENRDNAPKKG